MNGRRSYKVHDAGKARASTAELRAVRVRWRRRGAAGPGEGETTKLTTELEKGDGLPNKGGTSGRGRPSAKFQPMDDDPDL
jgi:hypothetical protein